MNLSMNPKLAKWALLDTTSCEVLLCGTENITIRKVKNHVPARYVITRKCHGTCNDDVKQWGCGGGGTNGKMGPGAAGKCRG